MTVRLQKLVPMLGKERNLDSSALPLCLGKPEFLLGQCAGVGFCGVHLTTATPYLNYTGYLIE